ncbi:PQQ-binding-like beta-propeller repeat protein [Streptomyces flavidovirens]|uniref:Vgb family protein n=1 Tax=Streptomyces flavidovirens TaxID=67298 RepID=UPI0036BF92F9
MHAVVSNRAVRGGVRGRRARWVAAALAVAALTGGASLADTTPAAADQAPVAAPSAEPPLTCPSVACHRAVQGLDKPWDTAFDSSGGTMYVTDEANGGSLWKVDTATGTKSEEPVTTGIGQAQIVLADDETGYFVDFRSDKLWRVEPATGKRHEVATLANPNDLALDGQGNAYIATGEGSNALYKVDLKAAEAKTARGEKFTDRELSVVTTSEGNLYAVALDGQGSAYVVNRGSRLDKVNLTTGRKATVTDKLNNPSGVALDGHGHAYISTSDGGLYRVELAGGADRTPHQAVTGLGSAR